MDRANLLSIGELTMFEDLFSSKNISDTNKSDIILQIEP